MKILRRGVFSMFAVGTTYREESFGQVIDSYLLIMAVTGRYLFLDRELFPKTNRFISLPIRCLYWKTL